jgi:hypothetical protein
MACGSTGGFLCNYREVELEQHAHTIGDQSGKLRFPAFRNKVNMGGFRDAPADNLIPSW